MMNDSLRLEKMEHALTKFSYEHKLTQAESHILLLLWRGLSPKEVAAKRERSIETVRTQIKQTMQKLDINRITKATDMLHTYL